MLMFIKGHSVYEHAVAIIGQKRLNVSVIEAPGELLEDGHLIM